VENAAGRPCDGDPGETGRRRTMTKPSASCGVAVMAKASAAGRTKTRLVPPLTYDEAAALNTAFLKDIAENIQSATQTSIAGYFAFGPPGSSAFFHDRVDARMALFEAWLPDFGDCLHFTISELLRRGHAGAIVLNADSPTLPTALLIEAADVLTRPGDRAVLGPAEDGGYYLLGLKRAHRHMFEDIAWSTSRVADQTMERARALGLELHVLTPWYDVDNTDSLRRLHRELADGRPFDPLLPPYRAAHTRERMKTMRREAALARRLGGIALEDAESCS
jgi:rSAM/selenodomain-associated transferase 1